MTPLEALAVASLALAALPAALTAWNLALLRAPRADASGPRPRVSVLVPARDEEASIGAAVRSALESRGADVEVVVVDDASTDRTAEVVAGLAAGDPRVRLVPAPPLPRGWNGKQHACAVAAREARHPVLVFIDADVRLAPDAVRRAHDALAASSARLLSGVPRQRTGTLAEALVVPLVHTLLLGYLPLALMRRSASPMFAAGCGQLFVTDRASYDAAGGHAAIRASRHDGLTFPRAFRRAGMATDLFDATGLARCRMYRGARQVWDGFAKNAAEGMAGPAAIVPWTVLLAGGHVLPFALAPAALASGAGGVALPAALAAAALALGTRLALAARFSLPVAGALLHPVGVLAALVIQWRAWLAERAGRGVAWKGRLQHEA